MIQKNTLTIEWIEKVSQAHRKADRILVEKVIRALMLLEGLANSGMPFIFKGGTALMLLTDSPKRLSIDIDIILHQTPKNLEEILNSFVASQGFNKLELQHRHIESTIKKAHYKFYYTPIHKTTKPKNIFYWIYCLNPTTTQKLLLHQSLPHFYSTTVMTQ